MICPERGDTNMAVLGFIGIFYGVKNMDAAVSLL